jgi:hypothetical protein
MAWLESSLQIWETKSLPTSERAMIAVSGVDATRKIAETEIFYG